MTRTTGSARPWTARGNGSGRRSSGSGQGLRRPVAPADRSADRRGREPGRGRGGEARPGHAGRRQGRTEPPRAEEEEPVGEAAGDRRRRHGAAVVVFRKFFGSKDADWQAARPSTPYAPPPHPRRPPPRRPTYRGRGPGADRQRQPRWTPTPRPVTIPRAGRPPTTKASRPRASRCPTSRPKAGR